MGITGLLPFLEKCSERTNINKFSGGTVAIDTYCWLHKGVFACADKLSMGQQTKAYINYCMKQIHMLLAYKIKPILVFDGRHLPAKAQTEAKRREARETNRRKAAELMQMGQHAEGRNLLRRSIDVTHEMALELIKECHKMNIDCIVAPYEADAQLAYLNINGIADVVITEDSDLTLFGCKKIFFKMDANGNGLLVQQDLIHLAMGVSSADFSIDEFRYMCILSGCDYLSSLPGIGLSKARKFIRTNKDCNIHRALTRLGSYLNMKSLVVTQEYRDAFILADITFKHQLVFCPLQRKQVRLNPPMSDVTEEQLYYAGAETSPDIALQLAYGNCDPFTLKMLHNFDPVLIRRTNLFAKQPSSSKTSPSLLFKHKNRLKGRNIMRLRRTIVNEEVVTESKFFTKPTNETDSNVVTNDNTLCSSDNSNKILLEKENINKNESEETNDIKLQALMITDEVKTDTYRMDVDEEHNASNECKATKYSNSSFNCNLMTSPVNVQISESLTHKTNINESCNLNSSLTVSEVDTDFDFLIQQGDISTLSNSLFKWSDRRQCVQINKKAKCDKYRNSKSRTVVNNTRRSQQLCSVQRQQGLLSMYGFEKKKLA